MCSNSVRVAASAALICVSCFQAFGQETRLEEVVVTSTPLHENPLEIAQPASVLGGDELRRQVAASLGETLSGELGLSSTYFGPSASQPVIRGLGGYRVQVLQDGAATLDVSNLSQDHAVSVESVVSQQIEIIKGPASLLYGSGAAGGLINVVTSRIPTELGDQPSAALELRTNSASKERTGAAAIDGAIGVLGLHADYFDRTTSDVSIPSYAQSTPLRRALAAAGEEPNGLRGRLNNSASDSRGGAVGASLIGDSGYFGISGNRYESTYGIPAEETAFIDMQQDRLDARGEWRPAGSWLDTMHISAARSDYWHTEFEAPGEPGTTFNQLAYELRLTADHHWGEDWRGTIGTQYVDTDFVAIGDEAFVPPAITRSLSVFAFEERHFERWTIELGARTERQTIDPQAVAPGYSDTAFNASAGLVFKLSPNRALALNLTHTQRHPQSAELYANGPHIAAGRVEVGDATLDKESALTADLSLRGTGDGVRWTLSGFFNDYAEYIYLRPTGAFEGEPDEELLPVNEYLQGGAKLFGYEAEIEFPLFVRGDQSVELRLASDYVRGKLDNGEDLPQIPPLRVGAGLHFEANAWHVGIEAFRSLSQDNVSNNELPTEGYTLLDVDVSYRMPLGKVQALLFVRATNLLDEDARLATSPLKDIAPLPGRALQAGIRAEL
jgi:iron complex outermembrane receptor protein